MLRGQVALSTITLINSHEELMDRIGMSLEAQGRYGFFSASVKAEFTESSTYNSTSTFLVAKVIVQNPFKRGVDFSLKQSAKDVLDDPVTGVENFKKAFGDSFVRGLQTGGEFYAVIRITSILSRPKRNSPHRWRRNITAWLRAEVSNSSLIKPIQAQAPGPN